MTVASQDPLFGAANYFRRDLPPASAGRDPAGGYPSSEPLFPTGPAADRPSLPGASEMARPDRIGQGGPDEPPVLPDVPSATWPAAPEPAKSFPSQPGAPSGDPGPGTPSLAAGLPGLDRRFAVVLNQMQHGAWPQVVEGLRALQADYPHAPFLTSLLEEATLKAELMTLWADKIKGRRFTVSQERLLRRALPFFLVLLLFLSSAIFYQSFVAPSREVVAMVRANGALVDEATARLQAGNYHEAMALYRQVLERAPDFAPAQAGLAEARRQLNLAVSYDMALQVAAANNLPRALKLLAAVQDQQTGYRDTDMQVKRLQGLLQVSELYAAAEKAFAQHRWQEAVQGFVQVKGLAPDFRAETLALRLAEAYLYAGQDLLLRRPVEGAGPKEARDYLRKAQAAGLQPEIVTAALDRLDLYLKAERAFRADDLEEAINLWRGIYDQAPAYLGGYLAEQLYQAYLDLGDQAAADGNADYAAQLYTLAAGLAVQDHSAASSRLQQAPATPTPLPTPVPVAAAPVIAVPVAAVEAVPPAPEPTATPTPAASFQGWIAFRTTRNGSEEIFVMRADGSEQQPAPVELRGQLDQLYQHEQWAPDGSRHVYVQAASGRSDANLYVAGADGQGLVEVTHFVEDEYDPAWSRDGQWIAFVSNHTGNDEIWLMRADGSEPRQLTWNNWEWDKHPTWSPDSRQLAFFSNRTGKRQIWAMGSDGSGQRNLSNNNYDDWDPVWIH
jgi:TolB protein